MRGTFRYPPVPTTPAAFIEFWESVDIPDGVLEVFEYRYAIRNRERVREAKLPFYDIDSIANNLMTGAERERRIEEAVAALNLPPDIPASGVRSLATAAILFARIPDEWPDELRDEVLNHRITVAYGKTLTVAEIEAEYALSELTEFLDYVPY